MVSFGFVPVFLMLVDYLLHPTIFNDLKNTLVARNTQDAGIIVMAHRISLATVLNA